jgi:DNA-binding NtrC family response regulator
MNAQAQRHLIYVTRRPDSQLQALLQSRDWEVSVVETAREALRLLNQHGPSAGLIDFGSDFSPTELSAFEPCLSVPNVGWIAAVTNGQLDDRQVRRLVRDYCFDYVTLPYPPNKVADSIGHAFGMVVLVDIDAEIGLVTHDEMVGTCAAMQQLFQTIRKVANTDASVFISGESGTGKELTALAIHERSVRRKGPFVAINCGAIPHHLMQSELFGYERGAFTGANQRKTGRVEMANGGTLFLDEIGDLPHESQASLLRFLQENKVERLGGREPVPVDVRIVTATHVDLDAAIRDGRFRTDLFHRLCVLRVDEPPLRARGKDIEILAFHMLNRFRADNSRKIRGFTAAAIEAMYNYSWPGNVRELINRVRRAIVMCEGSLIDAEDLDLDNFTSQRAETLAQVREQAEIQAIGQALLRHGNRVSEAALDLGVSRVTLYRLMSSYGMRTGDDRDAVQAGKG